MRNAGEEMQPGVERDAGAGGGRAGRLGRRPAAVRRVGRRRARLPRGRRGGRRGRLRQHGRARGARRHVPPCPPDSFDPAELGVDSPSRRALRHAAGDRRLAGHAARRGDGAPAGGARRDVEVRARPARRHRDLEERPAWTGAGSRPSRCASASPTPWWCSSAPTRASRCPARAASEVECCGPAWAAAYAYRVAPDDEHLPPGRPRARVLADAAGAARRRPPEVARAVNAAIEVAAQPYRAQVRVLDMDASCSRPAGATATRWTSTGAGGSCARRTAST